jgi:peptide/nickel transport system permease protein
MAINVILKRFGSLLALILLGYILTEAIPGNPGQRVWESGGLASGIAISDAFEKMQRERFGTDLPSFYFSIAPLALPNLSVLVPDKRERVALGKRMLRTRDVIRCMAEYRIIKSLLNKCNDSGIAKTGGCQNFSDALYYSEGELFPFYYKLNISEGDITEAIRILHSERRFNINRAAPGIMWWIPSIHWQGNNRLHLYLFGNGKDRRGLFRGDLGLSASDGIPVKLKLSERFPISLTLGFFGWLIAVIYSFIAGILMRARPFNSVIQLLHIFFMILPSFLLGTFLLLLFANPSVLNMFPTSGISPPGGFSENSTLFQRLSYWILPVLTFCAGTASFLSLTFNETLQQFSGQPYIKTAISKGLSPRKVFFRHVLRNALPGLTVTITHVLPAIVTGAVIIEAVFSMPGLGKMGLDALLEKDLPIVIAIILLSGIASILAYWLSDFLQYILDPRIRNPTSA